MEVKKIRQVPEKVVFASFAGKLKPSFLWCQYSMLRTLSGCGFLEEEIGRIPT
jgi:hypothetical protein